VIKYEESEHRPPPQISYDPYAKPPTYNLATATGDDDGIKAEKKEKFVYNHKEDIR
jgi:hypothetical protein